MVKHINRWLSVDAVQGVSLKQGGLFWQVQYHIERFQTHIKAPAHYCPPPLGLDGEDKDDGVSPPNNNSSQLSSLVKVSQAVISFNKWFCHTHFITGMATVSFISLHRDKFTAFQPFSPSSHGELTP